MIDQQFPVKMVLPPELAEIVERMRGNLSPERFLLVLLRISESGVVSGTPPSVSMGGRAAAISIFDPEEVADRPKPEVGAARRKKSQAKKIV